MMESFESLRNSYETLKKGLSHLYNTEEAKSVSKILLAELMGDNWFFLSQKLDNPISDIQKSKIQQAYTRLLTHEPIQYILGKAHFYGRDFIVSPDVLIPRGETEELMVSIRDTISQARKGKMYTWYILDIGTGTGCIPISLQLELQNLKIKSYIRGLDISTKALEVARENGNLHQADIVFNELDIFKADKNTFGQLDIIVSNPPYIPQYEKGDMHANVTEYEPKMALFVPDDDPLIFYRKITQLAISWLKPEGFLFFEIHEDMGSQMLELFETPHWETSSLKKDIHGKERILIAQKSA